MLQFDVPPSCHSSTTQLKLEPAVERVNNNSKKTEQTDAWPGKEAAEDAFTTVTTCLMNNNNTKMIS